MFFSTGEGHRLAVVVVRGRTGRARRWSGRRHRPGRPLSAALQKLSPLRSARTRRRHPRHRNDRRRPTLPQPPPPLQAPSPGQPAARSRRQARPVPHHRRRTTGAGPTHHQLCRQRPNSCQPSQPLRMFLRRARRSLVLQRPPADVVGVQHRQFPPDVCQPQPKLIDRLNASFRQSRRRGDRKPEVIVRPGNQNAEHNLNSFQQKEIIFSSLLIRLDFLENKQITTWPVICFEDLEKSFFFDSCIY